VVNAEALQWVVQSSVYFNMFVFDYISYIKVIFYITLSEHTTWMNYLQIKKNNYSSYSETVVTALNVTYMLGYKNTGVLQYVTKN
jgi:hypothetical protein